MAIMRVYAEGVLRRAQVTLDPNVQQLLEQLKTLAAENQQIGQQAESSFGGRGNVPMNLYDIGTWTGDFLNRYIPAIEQAPSPEEAYGIISRALEGLIFNTDYMLKSGTPQGADDEILTRVQNLNYAALELQTALQQVMGSPNAEQPAAAPTGSRRKKRITGKV